MTMAMILFVLQGQAALSAAMFVLGLMNSSYALAFSIVKELAPKHLSGVAMGMTNMMIMGIGGLAFQPLIGVFAHARGEGVPGAAPLSVIIAAQVLALAILGIGASLQRKPVTSPIMQP